MIKKLVILSVLLTIWTFGIRANTLTLGDSHQSQSASKTPISEPDYVAVGTPPKNLVQKDIGSGCKTALDIDSTTGLPYLCCETSVNASKIFRNYCGSELSKNPSSVLIYTDHKGKYGCTKHETLWACIWPQAPVRASYSKKCEKGEVKVVSTKKGSSLVCQCEKNQSNHYSFAKREFINGPCRSRP